MTLERMVLELDADVDGDGNDETGVFEMLGDLQVRESVSTRFLVGGRGSMVNNIISNNFKRLSEVTGGDFDGALTRRAGYFLDLGAGNHTFNISFMGWKGAVDGDGNDLVWGDPDEEQGGVANATGEDAMSQVHCFKEYVRVGEYDSRGADARLRYGEYSDGKYADEPGLYDDYLQVVVQEAQFTQSAQEHGKYDGSVTLQESLNWNEIADAAGRVEW